ncbi:MAG TPA: hypothetical protein VFN55_13625 [Solirubrobacteraceae bacterium]|nr:hypothetical protein [Solirubrobacteraceae bacterium]
MASRSTARAARSGAAARGFSPGSGFLSDPTLGAARLSGSYAVTGVVSTAIGVPGEAPGQQVTRSWTLTPACPTGPCALVGLRRQRVGATDSLTLRRVAPGLYQGAGRFTAPVQCHGRVYPAGAWVPYRITLIVTAAVRTADGSLMATGFTATYAGGPHIGRTRCFQPPTHDAAAYSGVLAGG